MVSSELTANDPFINRIVEGYHFLKRLGAGTYGVVYLARHPRMKERLVAVKYVRLGDPGQVEKVEREVHILSRLQHPNVVNVYDAYRFDHYQLIVMELIRGGNLHTVLRGVDKQLNLKAVIGIVEQLAFALGYVHSQNILHLDLKPSNILLDPIDSGNNVRFVLTDFGIARIINPSANKSTNIVGTPTYMSPEHFGFGDNKPDYRSDIYSLGIILYELLVGYPPFRSDQLLELLSQHAFVPPKLPSQLIDGIPDQLDYIVGRALAKAPEDRFQSASEFGNALRGIHHGAALDLHSMPDRLSPDVLGAVAQSFAEANASIDVAYPSVDDTDARFRLRVTHPDGQQEVVTFENDSVTLGRTRHADFQLRQTTISREHTKIECDDTGDLFVTDLGSMNGTYIDGERITPLEQCRWRSGQFMQIQGFLLEQVEIPRLAPLAHEPLTAMEVVELLDEWEEQHSKPGIKMILSPTVVDLEHEQPHYIQVHVTPRNAPSARYELRAKPGPGIDEQWYTLPAAQSIHSGETRAFDLIVRSPVVGTVAGETYELALEVVSDNPDIPSAIQVLKVKVVPFTRFAIAVTPREISHSRRRQAHLVISNNSNQAETFTIAPQNPDLLQITPQVSEITVQAGVEERVALKFKPARGAQRQRSRLVFTVGVHAASGVVEYANGSYILQTRRLFSLRFFILWGIFVIILARLLLFGTSIQQQIDEVRIVIEYLIRLILGRLT